MGAHREFSVIVRNALRKMYIFMNKSEKTKLFPAGFFSLGGRKNFKI